MCVEGERMRTFLIAVALLATAATPVNAATRNFGITGFTKIRVSGPYRVNIQTDVPPFVRASGSPAATDRIAVEVRGDTLVVQADPSWGGYPGRDPGPVEITIGTHDLKSASLIGSGAMSIDKVRSQTFALMVQGSGVGQIASIATDRLDVSLEGSANARVAGKAGKVVALVRGMSALDATALSTPSADISADGAAAVNATVTDTARLSSTGPATIRFAGRPACDLNGVGSATVSGCR